MRCVEFAARWNEALDLRECPEGDTELRAHLESCAACRASHAGFELVCDILSAQPLPDLLRAELSGEDFSRAIERDDLTERVLADLAAPRPAGHAALAVSRFRGLAVRAGAIGVAAATLLAMYLSSGWQADMQPLPAPLALHSGPAERAEAAAGDAAPAATADDGHLASLAADENETPGSFEQAGFGGQAVARGIDAVAHGIDAVGAVARDTSQELATVVRRIPDVAIELAGDGRTDLTAASEPLLSVSQSLRPVAASMTETWQILKRAIPTGEPRRG